MKHTGRILRCLAILLSLGLFFALFGCGSGMQSSETEAIEPSETQATDPSETQDPEYEKKLEHALAVAKEIVETKSISKTDLTWKIQSEYGIKHMDAIWVAENSGADWNEEALENAKELLASDRGWTPEMLDVRLKGANFWEAERAYAIENCGADWREETLKAAEKCCSHNSRSGVIESMTESGFLEENINWALEQLDPDWKQQAFLALEAADIFQRTLAYDDQFFDKSDWRNYLRSLGFSAEEADYAVKKYDALLHPVVKTPKTSKVFDERGNLLETNEYDERGNLRRTVYSVGPMLYTGGSSTWTYDAEGRLTERIDRNEGGAIAYQEHYTYNDRGDILTYDQNTGTKDYYEYLYEGERIGKLIITTKAGQKEKAIEERSYIYREDGQLERIDIRNWNADTGSWKESYQTFTYSFENDRLVAESVTTVDTKTNKLTGQTTETVRYVTVTQYDEAGRVILWRHTAPEHLSKETRYTYNEYGLLSEKIVFLQESRKYTYTYWEDEMAVRIPKTSQTSYENGTLIESAEYDEHGNKTLISRNGKTVATYAYDENGRMTEEVIYPVGDTYDCKKTYSYNQHGDLKTLTEDYPLGEFREETYTYQYKKDGKIRSSVKNVAIDGKTEQIREEKYTYDEKGNVLRIDVLNRLSAQNTETRGLITYEYTYDSGRIVKSLRMEYDGTEEKESSILSAILEEYDGMGRVVFERHSTGGSAVGEMHEISYTYNKYGLLASKTEFLGAVLIYTYTYWDD